jgi:hypothetical protein
MLSLLRQLELALLLIDRHPVSVVITTWKFVATT